MTILEKLKYERIFKIKKLENGNFKFKEQCDDYFQIELTKEEIKQLIIELEELIK